MLQLKWQKENDKCNVDEMKKEENKECNINKIKNEENNDVMLEMKLRKK